MGANGNTATCWVGSTPTAPAQVATYRRATTMTANNDYTTFAQKKRRNAVSNVSEFNRSTAAIFKNADTGSSHRYRDVLEWVHLDDDGDDDAPNYSVSIRRYQGKYDTAAEAQYQAVLYDQYTELTRSDWSENPFVARDALENFMDYIAAEVNDADE